MQPGGGAHISPSIAKVLSRDGFLVSFHFFAIEAYIDVVVIAFFLAVAAPIATGRIGGSALTLDIRLTWYLAAMMYAKVCFGWWVPFEIGGDNAGRVNLFSGYYHKPIVKALRPFGHAFVVNIHEHIAIIVLS